MDFWETVMGGMPHDAEEEAETVIACEGMAHALWQFYSACRKQGFKEDHAYGLTLTYFEGIWEGVGEAADAMMEDDCK